jgi:hypothetical protein
LFVDVTGARLHQVIHENEHCQQNSNTWHVGSRDGCRALKRDENSMTEIKKNGYDLCDKGKFLLNFDTIAEASPELEEAAIYRFLAPVVESKAQKNTGMALARMCKQDDRVCHAVVCSDDQKSHMLQPSSKHQRKRMQLLGSRWSEERDHCCAHVSCFWFWKFHRRPWQFMIMSWAASGA